MRYFVFLTMVLGLLSCNNNKAKETPVPGDTTTILNEPVTPPAAEDLEKKVTDTLMKLSFVKESDRYIDSLSDHKHGIAFMQDTSGGMIAVKAGYNGPERFETYYNFSIDPKTFEIKILDPVSGDYQSIEEYLKMNGK
jgi:hypothetical protein